MEQKKIERHFNNGEFTVALEGLRSSVASAWRDTTLLRCYRSMGRAKEALNWATKLHKNLIKKTSNYPLNTSERNNQLRYIALVFAERGKPKKACKILHSLCKNNPEVAALHREYAFALINNSKFDLAEDRLIKALELQPKHANTHAQLGGIYCQTGRLDAGFASYTRAATLAPKNSEYRKRLIYWSNFSDQFTQQSNYQLTRLWANSAHLGIHSACDLAGNTKLDRKLNIGFVSSDFYASAISFFVTPLFEGLDRNKFKVIAYSDAKKTDSVSESIKELCDIWCDSSRMLDIQLAKHISADKIDILVDLNGHKSGNRLSVFAKHLAPIQASWLGYPATTGLRSIAYRITDRIADPTGSNDRYFSEQLLRLPSGHICYHPLKTAPDIKPSDNHGQIRFGSFNNLAKISSLTMDAWAAAMLAVPGSTLYLKRQQLISANAADFFVKEFADRGITVDRLILKTSKDTIEEHLEEYNHIDIALDTSPYNGTTTTLEALWMGVPVITLIGETHASRITASILNRLHLNGLATESVLEFADRAKELSEMNEMRNNLRDNLRRKMRLSNLMNKQQFSNEFGNALRSQWQDWCKSQSSFEPDADTEKESTKGA